MTYNTCLYDGSLEGLLTVAAVVLNSGSLPDEIVPESLWQSALFSSPVRIATDPSQADSLMDELRSYSSQCAKNICYCGLAEMSGCERDLVRYIILARSLGKRIDRYHADPSVNAVHTLARKVGGEIHRLSGLVRFRELKDGTLWAPIEPDYNIVVPLSRHFVRRLPRIWWVLYDMNRDSGVIWNTSQLLPVVMDSSVAARVRASGADCRDFLSDAEYSCQSLWRQYFDSISIDNRKNTSLQRSFMPQRYWKYLVEKPGPRIA